MSRMSKPTVIAVTGHRSIKGKLYRCYDANKCTVEQAVYHAVATHGTPEPEAVYRWKNYWCIPEPEKTFS